MGLAGEWVDGLMRLLVTRLLVEEGGCVRRACGQGHSRSVHVVLNSVVLREAGQSSPGWLMRHLCANELNALRVQVVCRHRHNGGGLVPSDWQPS